MFWLGNFSFFLLAMALCLTLLAACIGGSAVPRPTGQATKTPTRESRADTDPHDRAVETVTPILPGEIRSLELEGYLCAAPIWTFDLRGDLAYVGQGRMLAIVRLTDPVQIQRVGYVVLRDGILDVATAGDPSTGGRSILFHLHSTTAPDTCRFST